MGTRLFESVGVSAVAAPRAFAWPVSAGIHVVVVVAVASASALARVELPPVPGIPEVVRLPLPAGPAEGPPALPRKGPSLHPRSRGVALLPPQARIDVPSMPPSVIPDGIEPSSSAATALDFGDSPGVCVGCAPSGYDDGSLGRDGPREEAPGLAPIRVSAGVQPPRKLRQVDPVYPELARAAHVEGRVVLDCVIGVDGRVTDVRVVRGVALLNEAAVNAVEQWIYVPTLLSGRPVAVILTVTVEFHLAH
jgi:protein TonB